MALVPFQDRPPCLLCANDGITYVACTAARRVEGCVVIDKDHLHLTCLRCGDAWLMDKRP